MAVIDERGSLFGRFNIIDAAIALFLLGLVPMGYVAYRVFRLPAPVIASVNPSRISADVPLRIRVTGQNFRPYLNAYVAKTGEAFSLATRVPDSQQALYLIQTPTIVELKLPDLGPGRYDIYLFDEGREVARRTSAFSVEAAAPMAGGSEPDSPVADAGTVEIVVRFDAAPEIAALMKAGDADLNQPETGEPAASPAVITSLRRLPDGAADMNLYLADGAKLAVSTSGTLSRLEAVLRLGVRRSHGVWMYSGPQRIRAGEHFSFATASYVVYNGLITNINVLSRRSLDAAAGSGSGAKPDTGRGPSE